MTLIVVNDPLLTYHDQTKGQITFESTKAGADAIEELQSAEAKNKAIVEAAKMGLPDPRVDPTTQHPYGVTADGLPLAETPEGLRTPVAKYRVGIHVIRRL